MKSRWLLLLALAAVVAAIGFGLLKLMHLRLERGDVYPPGSSLRGDPLGTKALAESLEALPEVAVEQNFENWARLELPADATLYVFRAGPEDVFRSFEARNRILEFVNRGGRVVLTHHREHSWTEEVDEEMPEGTGENQPIENSPASEEPEFEEFIETEEDDERSRLADVWKLGIDKGELEHDTASAVSPGSPELVTWRNTRFFDEIPEGWETLYETSNGPVAVQRAVGRGEVIVLTDTYLFSNEALFNERETELLNWIQGDRAVAVFDERHFGVAQPTGIAILMRRYQLGGLAAALLLAAALFIWRNLYSLTPVREPTEDTPAGVVRMGGGAHTGMRNLLKRAIAPGDLLGTCVDRFCQQVSPQVSGSQRWRLAKEEIDAVMAEQAIKPARKRRPIATYLEIVRILTKHRIHLR